MAWRACLAVPILGLAAPALISLGGLVGTCLLLVTKCIATIILRRFRLRCNEQLVHLLSGQLLERFRTRGVYRNLVCLGTSLRVHLARALLHILCRPTFVHPNLEWEKLAKVFVNPLLQLGEDDLLLHGRLQRSLAFSALLPKGLFLQVVQIVKLPYGPTAEEVGQPYNVRVAPGALPLLGMDLFHDADALVERVNWHFALPADGLRA